MNSMRRSRHPVRAESHIRNYCDLEGIPRSAVFGDVSSEETVVLVDHDLVTFADGPLQAFPVEYYDRAADVTDQSAFLQIVSCDRDALTSNPEHIGDQVVCHYQLVGLQLIVVDQQPSAKLLFDAVKSITDSGL
jgi:hypothetical protein